MQGSETVLWKGVDAGLIIYGAVNGAVDPRRAVLAWSLGGCCNPGANIRSYATWVLFWRRDADCGDGCQGSAGACDELVDAGLWRCRLSDSLLALVIPRSLPQFSRIFALLWSLATFVASVGLVCYFDRSVGGNQFAVDIQWIASPDIHFFIAADGVSLWLVLLSTFLTPLCVLISWNTIQDRVKEFFAFLLLLEFGLIGVFISQDLFLFYVRFGKSRWCPCTSWLGSGGHERRIYAAVKFFLYTMAGSVLMLTAIIYLYNKTETFSYFLAILEMLSSGQLSFAPQEGLLLFLAFFVAFAIKVPLFPLHTWLPDAHVEAPTAGSIMLASVMLKDGHVRYLALLSAAVSSGCAAVRALDRNAGDHRNRLWRAGCHGAAEYEETGGVFLGKPPWIRSFGNLLVHTIGPGWRGLPNAESRHLYRRAFCYRRSLV